MSIDQSYVYLLVAGAVICFLDRYTAWRGFNKPISVVSN